MYNLQNLIDEWLEMNRSGNFLEAKSYYFDTLFAEIIKRFENNNSDKLQGSKTLFSILGFTPEPIILTQRALNPDVHVIFYTDKNDLFSENISPYLSEYLTSNYHLVELKDESFSTIYETLKEQMILHPSNQYALDITGGKKSMVASAAIFGKDFNFNILYVDYDDYIPELRRPRPGTERLNIVYSPYEDLPELYASNLYD